MYHTTNTKNVKSIFESGLIPKKPDYGHGKDLDWKFAKGVYLTTRKPKSKSNDLITELRVWVCGLNLKKDKDSEIKSSFYCEEIITSNRILIM